jgi:tetratricopeptide (TPR) repeat protein
MNKVIITCFVLGFSLNIFAQKLPRTSPTAEVEQMVGLTEIEVKYSRPAVKNRQIFGEVVPFDELWRVGANERTVIEIEDDIKIGGKDLKAGEYGILMKPGKDSWTVLFSTNTSSWGTNDYDEKDDVLTLQVASQEAAFTENLLFYFDEVIWDKANLIMQWEKTKIVLPIEVDVDTKAWAGIQEALRANPDDAMILRNAARYCSDSGKRLDEGLIYIRKANEIKSSWFNKLIEARILAGLGNTKEAKEVGAEAIKMGEETAKESGSSFAYKEMIEAEMAEWK